MHYKAFFGGMLAAIVVSLTTADALVLIADQLAALNEQDQHPPTNVLAQEPPEALPPIEPHQGFPFSEPVLRQGTKVIEASAAKLSEGIYLDINLKARVLTLFENGQPQVLYKVVAIGPPDLPTPTGIFKVLHKEEKHFASAEKVWMPWSMHIVGDIFVHGIPYYPNGRVLRGRYSHGCVRLNTQQQKELYQKVPLGRPVVVY